MRVALILALMVATLPLGDGVEAQSREPIAMDGFVISFHELAPRRLASLQA